MTDDKFVSIITSEVLDPLLPGDLFVIGHQAPKEAHGEMVAWLKKRGAIMRVSGAAPRLTVIRGLDSICPIAGG